MYIIQYPFKVKIGETFYKPNTPIEVENAEPYVLNGAKIIKATEKPKANAGRRQKKTDGE